MYERGIDRWSMPAPLAVRWRWGSVGGGPISVGTGKGVKGGRDGGCPGFSTSLVQARAFCLFRGDSKLIDAICPAALLLPQLCEAWGAATGWDGARPGEWDRGGCGGCGGHP